ncbi:hypothetical protein TNCV_4010481 [Trichonephila clavipes]|nr:hypothetical protein TNCV_4010481 [Trichonephila clavipes]
MANCDFLLFSKVKRPLKGSRFQKRSENAESNSRVDHQSKKAFQKCFRQWKECWAIWRCKESALKKIQITITNFVRDSEGVRQALRAILDCASESSFINSSVLDLGKEEKNQEVTYPASREDVLLGLFHVLSGAAAQDWRCALGFSYDEAASERMPTTPVVFCEQPLFISS